ncbi:MAG TPA: hypothetical protein EYP60_00440 [bacterium (Candidatus Stahlbacteria)]|nr:hypothetical protein [Candidatus Stahlbacteria bacterium]
MKKIFKYKLKLVDQQKVVLPAQYQMLSVQEQDGKLVLWAMVPMNTPDTSTQIRIIGTGNLIEGDPLLDFIDTVQMPNGLVWHVFEE